MGVNLRIEAALETSLLRAASPSCPPKLAEAIRYAVFPGGARIRSRLTLAVAAACGEDEPALVNAAAAAVELLHCASLVHDDLPCFDDAATRRGKAALHKAYDERLAVLAGDALIVLAYQTLAHCTARPDRLSALVSILSRAVGAPSGIIAGQAWECEEAADLETYHRQKTGALFAGAAMLGAASCGFEYAPWRQVGEVLGRAYQAADDIGDCQSDADAMGKPVGQDAALGRPSIVAVVGLSEALRQFDAMVEEAVALVPGCPGETELKALMVTEARRLLPRHVLTRAA